MNLKGKKFENSRLGMEIFVYEVDGKEMFIGRDIAKMLGYINPVQAVQKSVSEHSKIKLYVKSIENIEKLPTEVSEINTFNNNLILISESGVYQLALKSTKEKSVEFQQWICEEVLPSLRKNNSYIDNGKINNEQLVRLEKELNSIKKEKGMLHELVYDMADASTMSFTEASKKLFGCSVKRFKELLKEHGFIDENGEVIKREAEMKTPSGGKENYRIFTETNVQRCRANEDIRYNKITNFGYMYLKKYFNSKGLSDFKTVVGEK
ncbi:MAG: BRO-N domain-containing protein [Fusobacteriaceae bacterium]